MRKLNFMKRSKIVVLTILVSIAAMACDEPHSNEEIKHCVDQEGIVQDEAKCAAAPVSANPTTVINNGSPSPIIPYFWYYGGGYRSPVSPGTRVMGGSFAPSPGRSYSSPSTYSAPSTVSRGGFGSTGRSFSGGTSGGSSVSGG